ncbi:MAG: PEP-CTERM sorting domain-containing protein [Phycisphaerales bacterium JB063]
MNHLKIAATTAIAACLSGAATADHISVLADLIANDGTIQVGDKLFSNFDYAATGDMPDADNINVIEYTDSDGNFGIRFQAGFFDLPGGGSSDALITFDVTVLDPNRMISGAHLAGNPDVLGGNGGSSFGGITETFLTGNTSDSLSIFATQDSAVLADWVFFDTPTSTLSVQKNITLFADDDAVATTLSFVDQTFTQIPEPGSLALIGLGGLALLRRRR